ncbi:uncharacterized protein ACNLHF_023035 [Anomaloglossus baeobatrachus]
MYRCLPCLWKIKSADYSNRYKKRDAYLKLVDLVKKYNPTETVGETVVKKKIQALRTVFKRELNKVEHSSKSGAGTEELYVPKLWYYDLMSFTRDQEIPRPLESMIAVEEEEEAEVRSHSPVGDDHFQAADTPTGANDAITITQHVDSAEEQNSQAVRQCSSRK